MLAATTTPPLPPPVARTGSALPVFRPETYGAVADGNTDCYDAFQALVRAVNAAGSGRIEFSSGTYAVKRYRIRAGAGANTVAPFEFSKVAGLQLVGNNTVIDHMGDFARTADARQFKGNGRPFATSSKSSVSWQFRACSDVTLQALTLDGNADRMTRDEGVVEDAFGTGLRFLSCRGVSVTDVTVHHWYADGIAFTSDNSGDQVMPPCTGVVCTRVRSLSNGRCALNPANVRGGQFTDCQFNKTGFTDGAYGGHSPMTGMDIEPSSNLANGRVTAATGDLDFLRCQFVDNRGMILVAAYPERYAGHFSFTNCALDAGTGEAAGNQIKLIIEVPNGKIADSTINLRGGIAHLTWKPSTTASTTYTNVEFRSSRPAGAIVAKDSAAIELDGCRFIFESAPRGNAPLVQIADDQAVLRENYFYIPSAAQGRGNKPAVMIDARTVDANRYETDRAGRAAIVIQERGTTSARGATAIGNVVISR